MASFRCCTCESPAVLLPDLLDDTALVRCGRCGEPLGDLAAFRRFCADAIAHESRQSRPRAAVDAGGTSAPRVVGAIRHFGTA